VDSLVNEVYGQVTGWMRAVVTECLADAER
jgi:hypothetical protein